ncbi:hypothetical protein AVEN_211636-1 [Araneus ventricosus]|uniref:Uncharacterized protein n=1 Tax=Araneus ventricosus TaxID=182803 RepID=A0A4Y2JC50_ARAVE|nr:hypothetical protein AVEN_211636-1 [Araneus ventricosus]
MIIGNLKETRPGIGHPEKNCRHDSTPPPTEAQAHLVPPPCPFSIPSERTRRHSQDQTLADTCWSRCHKHHNKHQPRSKSTHTPP